MDDKKQLDNTERGFNDAELADIMSEIENLEKGIRDEMGDAVDHPAVEEPEVVEAPVAVTAAPEVESIVPMKKSPVVAAAPASTKMDFSVEGDMCLQLHFSVGGEHIGIHVNAAEGLVIELMNGAKFSVPVSQMTVKKAA